MPDIIVMGDINVDVVFSISGYPIPGTEAIATSVEMYTGGSAVNTAIALSKMDMDVGFIGRVGQDTLANQVLEDLKEAGLDCSQVQIDSRVTTGLIFIAVSGDSERTMFGSRGANAFTEVKAINVDYFTNCRWIHLSSYSFLAHHQYETLLTILDIAENSPYTRVSLDIATEPAIRARDQIMAVLPRLDVILPNETELSILGQGGSVEENLKYLLHKQGANAIITTQGDQGCLLAVADKRVQVPAFKIKTKDSTGAGDSFNAGAVLGRLIGLSWESAAVLGNAMGGFATTKEGSGAKIFNRNEIAKLIEKQLFQDEFSEVRPALEELMAWFEGML